VGHNAAAGKENRSDQLKSFKSTSNTSGSKGAKGGCGGNYSSPKTLTKTATGGSNSQPKAHSQPKTNLSIEATNQPKRLLMLQQRLSPTANTYHPPANNHPPANASHPSGGGGGNKSGITAAAATEGREEKVARKWIQPKKFRLIASGFDPKLPEHEQGSWPRD